MKNLDDFTNVFDGIEPYRGTPPKGYYADWIGALTDARFRAYTGMKPEDVGGHDVEIRLPTLEDGEGWFEAVNQVEAARAARGKYVMVTLGACYGAQAVGAYLALQKLNPMPFKLVAVEPEPSNLEWVAKHFRDNGIEPDEQWLIGCAIGASNEPTLFPVGAPGSGAQNAISTNSPNSRTQLATLLTTSGHRAKHALREILVHSSTGLRRDLLTGANTDARADLVDKVLGLKSRLRQRVANIVRGNRSSDVATPSSDLIGEIKLLSTVTLKDVLSPFDVVDYLEADIQQSESIVFPPFMALLKKKVRRVHIGTHGKSVHMALAALFRRDGWQIIFDFEPNSTVPTQAGKIPLNDGILSVVNPAIR